MDEAQHFAVCALSKELNEDNPMDAYDESSAIIQGIMNGSSYYMSEDYA